MAFKLNRDNVCARKAWSSHVLLDNVSKSFDKVKAVSGLTLVVEKGEFFSLLGPSGCGKTTTLRLIGGLDRPDEGAITIGNEVVVGEGVWVPPEKRGVGIVFQDYALFPHLTVFKNIAFGLKGCSPKELKQKVMELLEMVGLPHMAHKYPHELSGGERQRITLARSLAPSPKVMLLDEPFSSLDADLRDELRHETKWILKEKGTTTILVTHGQEEALSLSDRVGVLNNGKLEQVGTPDEIYHKPRSRFVADFVGKADFVHGWIEGSLVICDLGMFPLNGDIPDEVRDVELMIRPDDVDFTVEPGGNTVVIEAQFLGAQILYKLLLPDGKAIHSIKPSTKIIPVGSRVKIKVDTKHIVVFRK
ncbi:iron(III) transport system ATP-binding protein [Candidatus Hakubella thermalkaliphila]|uniref:ABC-type quaternary amine transporter n=1 Tax=Candidatus Hakubella thermalkaliphila TaxID=2754717 RepID=A0A6V8NL21_9ACTN|nr:ABC transporter ATP-binding protein [Candidatus Hakubella thermalkaliphila]GFP20777.1 iron(III) transport system ATP-binding protein [Candidatus Hakubella thermalkaliphila]